MAQPQPYNRQFNFADQQALTPSTPLPGTQVDAELNSVKLTFDQTLANLAKIQRDDGALKNGIVTQDSLSPSLSIGFTLRGPWETGVNYIVGDGVSYDSKFYRAIVANLSTSLNRPDLDTATWEEVADFAAISADAAASAAAALASENAAAASASAASGSAGAAASSASAASGSADAAGASATAADASATAADASADAAAASALEAANTVGDATAAVRWDIVQSLSASEKQRGRENIGVVPFTGDSGSGGAAGLVTAPAAGDAAAKKVLRADGTWARPGKILQCLEYIDTTNRSTGSTSNTDTNILIAITPFSATSKIRITAGVNAGASAALIGRFTIYRGTTDLLPTGVDSLAVFRPPPGGEVDVIQSITFGITDSPATTASTTYAIVWRTTAGTLYLGRRGSDTSIDTVSGWIRVEEIAA